MLAIDTHSINMIEYKKNETEYIKNLSKENAQLLIRKIYDLPIDEDDMGKYIELPNRISVLPREKPIPQPKKMTKWEELAKRKGIKKAPKEKLVYSKEQDVFLPSYGYGRQKDTDWVKPGKMTDLVGDDPFDLSKKRT